MAEISKKIEEFLTVQSNAGYGSGDGYGDGSGYVDGSGYGYGSGDGSGSGYGDGYGDGYGSGSGYGDGYGDGYGSGYGDGYGDGSGYGYGSGDGYGDGIKSFNGQRVYVVDGVSTIFEKVKSTFAKGYILNIDFTLTPCFVVKGRNQFAHGESLRQAQEALEEKLFMDLDVDERISLFIEKFELNKVYVAKEFYEWHNKLTGSCEMGRQAFARDHAIDIENDTMTVQEFVNLTKDSFGSSVIRQLAETLGLAIDERR